MKNILIFGGSGAIGRFLIRKLTKNNYTVTVVTRNIHQTGYIIKSQGNAGYIQLEEASIFDEKKIRKLFKNAEICINLVGILYQARKGNTFKNIHTIFPTILAKLCKEYNLKKFIHLSALGINQAVDSDYAKTKLDGEINILKNFPKSNILRPSIVYSSSDQFTCNFMTLLNRLPIFPLYYGGRTLFMPIHVNDLTNIIYHVVSKNIETNVLECVGPETLSFKEILEKLLKLIQKKRILIPLPLPVAKLSAFILGKLPKPLITSDQLRLLKYDNISSGKYKTNFDIGIPSTLLFEPEVEKYCYMWRDGGQFSTGKYTSNNDIEKNKKKN